MKNKIEKLTKDLRSAHKRFKEVMQKEEDEFIRDSAIQRFEFTYELTWKTMKSCLETKGIKVFSPLDSIKESFRVGLINEDERWIDMLKTRNLTTHTYKEAIAKKVYKKLNTYVEVIGKFINNLKEQGYALWN